jgi:hypothetical protein
MPWTATWSVTERSSANYSSATDTY